MSWADNTFFAPEALIDGKGRQIMWSWLTDDPHSALADDLEDGWSGVYGLPRVLWLAGENDVPSYFERKRVEEDLRESLRKLEDAQEAKKQVCSAQVVNC